MIDLHLDNCQAPYEVLMSYDEDGEKIIIHLSTVDDIQISSSINLSSSPMINGSIVSDHFYKKPITMSMSGSFTKTSEMSLTEIENLFEAFLRKGQLFEISKRSKSDLIFKARKNMLLSSVRWTEKVNSVDFEFSFDEVMYVSFEYDPDVFSEDDLDPVVTTPSMVSFTDVLIDKNQFEDMLKSLCVEAGWMTTDFESSLQNARNISSAISVGASTVGIGAVGTTVIGSLVTGAGVSAAIPVVGWISAGVALLAAVSLGIVEYLQVSENQSQANYLSGLFNYRGDKTHDEKVKSAYGKFKDDVLSFFKEIDKWFNVYKFQSVEGAQIANLQIGEYPFLFEVSEKKNTGDRIISVYNIGSVKIKEDSLKNIALSSVVECTSSNYVAKIENNYIYILHLYEDSIDEDDQDPGHYCVIVWNGINPDEYKEKLSQVLQAAIKTAYETIYSNQVRDIPLLSSSVIGG